MRDIVIYGASGHACVLIDIVEQANHYKIVGLVDDTGFISNVMGYPVVKDISEFCDYGVKAGIIAIGDNWQRSRITKLVCQKYCDFEFVTCVHPSANLARGVVIGKGSVVMAGCNINTKASIGNHCIINTGANLDHDCILSEFVSIAPGVTLGGNVMIDSYSAVGLGTSVIHKIDIGSHVVIGAGSVVVKNVKSNCIAYGNPCRQIKVRDIGSPYL